MLVILVEVFVEGLAGEIVAGIPQGEQVAFCTAHGRDVSPVRVRVGLVVWPAGIPQGGVVVEDRAFQPLGVEGGVAVLERITDVVQVEVKVISQCLFVIGVQIRLEAEKRGIRL